MGKIVKLSSETEQLTVEKLKTYNGLEDLTDDEAQKIIESIRCFARITYKAFREFKENKENQQKVA